MHLQRLRRLVLIAAVGACGKSESVPVTPPIVVASVTVAPDSLRLVVGRFASLTATVLGPDGQSTATPVTWESSNPTVATVGPLDRTVRVMAVAPGVTEVRATSRGRTGSAIVTVTPPQQWLTVLKAGDGNGSATSNPPGISCVTAECSGFFDYGTTVRLSASAGPASVVLSWGPPCSGTGECTVVMDQPRTVVANFGKYPRPVGSITVDPPLLILEEGGKGTVTATIRDPEGNILTDRPFTWSSLRPTSASVSPSGEVTGIIEDDTTWVIATSEGVLGNASVAVLAPEFRAINIGVGADHTCAFRKLNAVHCWGNARSGRLGNPDNPGGGPRVHVIGGRILFGTDGGAEHTCATSPHLVVHCWGAGDNGQLGDGLQTDSPVPVRVNATGQFGLTLGVGGSASCATDATYALYCWGANPQGTLGVGSSQPTVNTPAPVVGGLSVFLLDMGAGHICAITQDYRLYCWGQNASGQLGTGDLLPRTAPVQVTGVSPTVKSVTTGPNHTCAADFEGAVWCWGLNDKGQLGDGTRTSRTTPTRVTTPQAFGLVTAGEHHTCARTLAVDTYCWGDNSLGQLGDGTTTSSNVPVRVATGLKLFSTKAGANHTCGVTAEHVLRCWGSNLSGQLGLTGVTSSKIPVAVPRP